MGDDRTETDSWEASAPRFVLFAHARSGSSTLVRILGLHHRISILGEPFGLHASRRGQPEYRAKARDADGVARSVAHILASYSGFKHIMSHLTPDLNHVLLRAVPRRLFLHRRNLLKTVVSLAISRETSSWDDSKAIMAHEFGPLGVRGLRQRIRRLRRHIREYRGWLEDEGLTYLDITYESLFGEELSRDQQLSRVERIVRYLGQPRFRHREIMRECVGAFFDPERMKVNSVATYRRIPNIDEIEARLGNDQDGYLFKDQPPAGA